MAKIKCKYCDEMTELKRYCEHCGAELEEWAAEQAKAAAEAKRKAEAEATARAQAAAEAKRKAEAEAAARAQAAAEAKRKAEAEAAARVQAQAEAAAQAKAEAQKAAEAAAQAAAEQAERANILEELTATSGGFWNTVRDGFGANKITVTKICCDEGAYVTPKDKVCVVEQADSLGDSSKHSVKPKTSGYIHYLCKKSSFFGEYHSYSPNEVLAQILRAPK
jgi:TolA protein